MVTVRSTCLTALQNNWGSRFSVFLVYLNVLGGLETIQLVEELEHGALHLTVSAGASLETRGADRVDLVHEDDGGRMLTGHHEKLAHHSRACKKPERT